MSNFLLIGGKSNEVNALNIYKYFINKTLLYVNLAKDDNDLVAYYNFINDNKDTKITLLTKEMLSNFYEEALKYDIIYFAGGTFHKLREKVINYNIDKALLKLKASNKLLVGVSAGAILFSQYGYTDYASFNDDGIYYNFKLEAGLGLLDIIFCPHYQKNGIETFNDEIKKYNIDAYALEDDTAILISLDEVKIIKDNYKNSVYYFKKEDHILRSLYA